MICAKVSSPPSTPTSPRADLERKIDWQIARKPGQIKVMAEGAEKETLTNLHRLWITFTSVITEI
jgi:hypothetical protein